jgi:hypothetical protein
MYLCPQSGARESSDQILSWNSGTVPAAVIPHLMFWKSCHCLLKWEGFQNKGKSEDLPEFVFRKYFRGEKYDELHVYNCNTRQTKSIWCYTKIPMCINHIG